MKIISKIKEWLSHDENKFFLIVLFVELLFVTLMCFHTISCTFFLM